MNGSIGLSPIYIFLAFALYGLVHSLLASRTAKDMAAAIFGSADRYYRLFFNAFGVITLLPVLALPALLPDAPLYRIPAPWLYLTSAMQLLSLLALAIALLQTGALEFLGLKQLYVKPADDPGALNISGFYRYMRHPLYTFGLLFIWFTPIMTINLLALYLSISLYILVGAYFEERRLEAEFGPVYAEYKARTSFLIPWPPKKP